MPVVLPHSATHVSRQACLGCGYEGAEIQSGREDRRYVCPRCGTDLYARPPRSYAQLELGERVLVTQPGLVRLSRS